MKPCSLDGLRYLDTLGFLRRCLKSWRANQIDIRIISLRYLKSIFHICTLYLIDMRSALSLRLAMQGGHTERKAPCVWYQWAALPTSRRLGNVSFFITASDAFGVARSDPHLND